MYFDCIPNPVANLVIRLVLCRDSEAAEIILLYLKTLDSYFKFWYKGSA